MWDKKEGQIYYKALDINYEKRKKNKQALISQVVQDDAFERWVLQENTNTQKYEWI